MELLAVIVQQLSIVSAASRRLQAVSCDTWLVPSSSPLVVAMKKALETYLAEADKARDHEDADERKKSFEGLGPPAPHLALAMLETLATLEVGGSNRRQLEDYVAGVEENNEVSEHFKL